VLGLAAEDEIKDIGTRVLMRGSWFLCQGLIRNALSAKPDLRARWQALVPGREEFLPMVSEGG
jgi:hypothetical protein